MSRQLVKMPLLSLFLLVGCAGAPTVRQDITLAPSAAELTPKTVSAQSSRSSDQFTQGSSDQNLRAAVMSGSGVATNIVSDPSLSANSSELTAAQSPAATPIAVPQPVPSPTRLARAVMIEPAAATSVDKDDEASSGDSSNAAKKIAYKVTTLKRHKPQCKGAECPVISFKRVSFTGHDRFNAFVEQTLLSLALVETNRDTAFHDLGELELYFFKTAKPRDEIALASSVKYMSENVVVVQLDSYIFTSGAPGISTTQYLNWLPKTDKLLTLETMLLPGKSAEFEELLKKQHALWLKKNPLAKDDPGAYNKLWPFTPSDNVALLENGMAVTYDPYRIAPNSMGKPTIYIPYRDLRGILRPELLSRS